jgi:hypothetical protein
LCLYCDTWDGNFWIDRDPEREGLVVAAGGSGHAFKFAPLIGGIIADVVEGRPNRFAHRFAWRDKGRLATEDARFSGQVGCRFCSARPRSDGEAKFLSVSRVQIYSWRLFAYE